MQAERANARPRRGILPAGEEAARGCPLALRARARRECLRILRHYAEMVGLPPTFSIYDSADQVRVVKQCLEELEKDPKRFVPRGVHAQISNAKNQLVTPAIVACSSVWQPRTAPASTPR